MSEQQVTVRNLIIGAGISGIGTACHLRRKSPEASFAILEARDGKVVARRGSQ